MEIRNEEHAREMLAEWGQLAAPAQRKEIGLAIQRLELSCMYYEQKGNSEGVDRCERCILMLKEELAGLGG
ncbi:MAG TPA: hypothetical protein DDY20_11025 [Desulfobulbaceae bacterium]|nr:hypothetical protein [Desulfobulbaceae bacterium]